MRFAGLLLFVLAIPATAAERQITVVDFDRLRINGNFAVEVAIGRATSVRVIAEQAAIDGTLIDVQGRTLTIRRDSNAWGEGTTPRRAGRATIRITVPLLTALSVSGPADVKVEQLRGPRTQALLEGAGTLAIAAIDSDRFDAMMIGDGKFTVAGRAADVTVAVRGPGQFDGVALVASDAKVASQGAGSVTLTAGRSADIAANGTGSVVVTGTRSTKLACTVRNLGSGTVACGDNRPR